MKADTRPLLLLIGDQGTLSYLLGRFAEHGGFQLVVNSSAMDKNTIVNPAVIIFLSTRLLETAQSFVRELASLDIPILVCASVAEQARARELGADHCLLHPLTYDDFQAALIDVGALKHA